MPWPSTVSSFNNPLPTDRLNSPSHSSVETAQNTGLTEIQTYLGLTSGANASALGTLIGTVMNPGSDGGGHVQSANKGGTGQTAYSKGDILVATSGSVLTKLSVGTNTQVLTVNSSAAAGINWANSGSPKLSASASIITIPTDGNDETSVLSVTVPGSTLGLSNVIRTTIPINTWDARAATSLLVIALYGGGVVGSVALLPISRASVYGNIHHTVIANNSSVLQRHFIDVDLVAFDTDNTPRPNTVVKFNTNFPVQGSSMIAVRTQVMGTSSVASSADQTLGMTFRIAGSNSKLDTGGHIVEKIT